MGIGTGKEHVLGRNQVVYVNTEATAGTFAKPETADCVRVESSSMKYEPSREPLNEGSEYADEVEMITGKAKATWSLDCDLIPSGTAATEPRLSALLTAAMGTNNAGADSHWLYSLSSTQNLPSLSIVRKWSTYLMEAMWGCQVEKMTVKLSGGKRSQIKFEGSAMGYALTGASVLLHPISKSITAVADGTGGTCIVTSASHELSNGESVTISGTTDYNGTFTVSSVTDDTFKITDTYVSSQTGTWKKYSMYPTAADAALFALNSVVKIGTDDNSGAGFKITADNSTYYTLEALGTGADGATIVPFAPDPTWLGSPLSGVLGTFTAAGGTTFPITDFELTLDKKLSVFDDEFGTQTFNDAAPGRREVTGKFDCRVRKDLAWVLANRKAFGTAALVATAGTTSGSRYVFTISQAEMGFAEVSSSGDKEVTMSVPFRALATTSGDNSFTADHT